MTFETEVTADAPELWWDTRQAVGIAQPDRSGNGHTGTLDNGPTIDPAEGITFDAALVQSIIGDDTFGPTTFATWALEIVFNAATFPGEPHLCGFPGPSSPSDFLTLVIDESAGNYGLNIGWRGTFSHGVTGPHTLTPATLYHVLADYDGTAVTVYLNGSVYVTQSVAADGATFADPEAFYIGDDTFGDPFDGLVRHGIFYDHPLGAVRAAAHATAALGDDDPVEPPAAQEWPTLALSADLPAATDLTSYGEEPAFNIQRGLSSPMPTGMVADAGTLSTLLDNISRDLDPDNASGPFAGFLRPKVPTEAKATWGVTTYDILSGRVDGWPQSYPFTGTDQVVEFRATDLFQFLANTPINTTRPAEKTHERVAAVLASIDYPGPTNIEPGLSTVYGQDLQTVAALSHLGDVAQVEYGEMGIDASGVFCFRGRNAIATDVRSTVVQAEYVQSGGLNFVDVTRGPLPLINHVTLTYGRNGRQVTVRDQDSIDSYDLQAASISLPFETYSQASTYGKWLLFLYSEPRTEFTSVTFEPYSAPGDTFDLWADVLSRKEGDLIQITLDPLIAPYTLAGDPIVETCWIRGINYQFDQWPKRVSFTVQSAWVDGLFYWDTSELDGPDHYGL